MDRVEADHYITLLSTGDMPSFAALSTKRHARLGKSVDVSTKPQAQVVPEIKEVKPEVTSTSPVVAPSPPPPALPSVKPPAPTPSAPSNLHGCLPAQVEIRTTPGQGRGVWTKRRKVDVSSSPASDGLAVESTPARKVIYSPGSLACPSSLNRTSADDIPL